VAVEKTNADAFACLMTF